jgi:hypothetical protein
MTHCVPRIFLKLEEIAAEETKPWQHLIFADVAKKKSSCGLSMPRCVQWHSLFTLWG